MSEIIHPIIKNPNAHSTKSRSIVSLEYDGFLIENGILRYSFHTDLFSPMVRFQKLIQKVPHYCNLIQELVLLSP